MITGLEYDPEIDTPATIAVIGGGPCGVEAALYARFLGYSVELFDSRKVGDSMLAWGQRPLPASWRDLASPLGLAALEAHDHPLPDPDQDPTYAEYVSNYLLPTARNDLLYSSVTIHAPVLSISRLGCKASSPLSDEDRAEQEFRLLCRSEQRGEFSQLVDIVLDCSGGQTVREGMASGGGLPRGWNEFGDRIWQGRVRILERKREQFAGKRVLLWGNDASAIANALELFELTQSSQTQLYWILPKCLDAETAVVRSTVDYRPLSQHELDIAAKIYQEDSLSVIPMAAWGIEAIQELESQWLVTVQTTESETSELKVDQIIHCGDCTGAASFQHNLRLEAISNAQRLGSGLESQLRASVLTAEPHYYLLGDRSNCTRSMEGQHDLHSFSLMREQIRAVFAMIGGRENLDLYKSVHTQAKY